MDTTLSFLAKSLDKHGVTLVHITYPPLVALRISSFFMQSSCSRVANWLSRPFLNLQTSSNFSKTSFFSDWVSAVTSFTPVINSSFSFSEKSLNYQLDSHRNNKKPTGSTLRYMYDDIVIICRPVIKDKLPLVKIQLNLSSCYKPTEIF